MSDRRLLTDVGLALLIAIPAALPAAPGPWSTNDDDGTPAAEAAYAGADERGAWISPSLRVDERG